MKKIAISLGIIGVVAAIVIGATTAYFSDTEVSGGNLFKAGTIDIQIEDDNFVWSDGATLADMKPCYTDYINFVIHNDGSNANPVNVWKKLYNFEQTTGAVSEPECTEQGGRWIGASEEPCDWEGNGATDRNNIASIIDYDLSVEVYDGDRKIIWWQTIYDKDVTVGEIRGENMYLGMIPAGGYMEVTQSYHMQDPEWSTNWAQGDEMAFDIEIKAVQLRGEAWLESKTGAEPWKIIHDDGFEGTLTYEVKNPTFDYTFEGTAPLAETRYCLFVGGTATGENWDADIKLGCEKSGTDNKITITGDEELGKDVKNAKAWLIKEDDYNGISWSAYNPEQYLWETGLIWYEDTDL